MTKLVQIEEPINNNLAVVFVYEEKCYYVLPVAGTHVPKYDGEAHSTFLLIKKVHLFCIRKGVRWYKQMHEIDKFNPLKAELNPICYLLALLGAHRILHISRIRWLSLYIFYRKLTVWSCRKVMVYWAEKTALQLWSHHLSTRIYSIIPTNAETIASVSTVLTLSLHIWLVFYSVDKTAFRHTIFEIPRKIVESINTDVQTQRRVPNITRNIAVIFMQQLAILN